MKRDKALIPLSHDHHKALVISNRIQATLDESEITASEYWNEIRTEVYEELLAHFNAEEHHLLLLLHEHGGHCLADRLIDDLSAHENPFIRKGYRFCSGVCDVLKKPCSV